MTTAVVICWELWLQQVPHANPRPQLNIIFDGSLKAANHWMQQLITPMHLLHLAFFINIWSAITTDKWVLSVIHSGYRVCIPIPSKTPFPTSSTQPLSWEHCQTRNAISLTLGSNTAGSCSVSREGFYSTNFLISKKKGGWRAILNLCYLKTVFANSSFVWSHWHL